MSQNDEQQQAADARRYRYLVDHHLRCVAHPLGEAITMDDVIFGDDPDTAIDEAMARRQELATR